MFVVPLNLFLGYEYDIKINYYKTKMNYILFKNHCLFQIAFMYKDSLVIVMIILMIHE